ncbi:MAG: hypothetical protein HFG05_06045 [Oscillibacter sp.]|nr:hypothetical protein [Oscillibacter sp.]
MDVYLDCLYQHVLEHLETDAHVDLVDYRRWRTARDMAWSALEEALTFEQLRLVENYASAGAGLRDQEDRLLFQKAVALGKWMARA